jgi:ubiquitin carboxyl-terminal hydrolase 9/24
VADLAPLEEELWQLTQHLAAGIFAREGQETDTKKKDEILIGMLGVLQGLLQKYPSKKKEIGAKLVPHLLKDCLFQIPSNTGTTAGVTKSKCKTRGSRQAALKLLAVLSRDSLDNLSVVIEYIKEFGGRASWRTNKSSDWAITHLDDEKSSAGYVGLKNLGCICYMISLFQQLYMVPGFRQDILTI